MEKGKLPQLPLPGEEAIKVGHPYQILTVEDFKSEVQGFIGWRVTLDGGKDDLIAIPLWVRDIVGRRSKMGAFIEVCGNDPEKWIGKVIKFVTWADKNRVIQLVEK